MAWELAISSHTTVIAVRIGHVIGPDHWQISTDSPQSKLKIKCSVSFSVLILTLYPDLNFKAISHWWQLNQYIKASAQSTQEVCILSSSFFFVHSAAECIQVNPVAYRGSAGHAVHVGSGLLKTSVAKWYHCVSRRQEVALQEWEWVASPCPWGTWSGRKAA